MEDEFILDEWEVEARKRMDIVGQDLARARRNYWINKKNEDEQERTIEDQFANEWKEYTSTGEEWEEEDW